MSENVQVDWVAIIDSAKKLTELKIEVKDDRAQNAAEILASWNGVFNV